MKEQSNNFIKLSKEKSKRYVNALHYLPWIMAGVLYLLFFAWAIIDACECIVIDLYFDIDSEFLCWVLCWFIWDVIGVVVSIITFFVTRLITARRLLQLYYLQKIDYDNKTVFGDENEITKEIQP